MKRKVKTITVILTLVSILSLQFISYAISNENESSFFTVNKLEISPKDTLEMTIDLSKIKYEEFKFKLDSNINAEDIQTDGNANVSVDNNNNDVNISIDKTKMNLNKITLYYVIPEDMKIGTKIQLTAQIIANVEVKDDDTTNETNNLSSENIVDNNLETNNVIMTDIDKDEIKTEEQVVMEQKIEIAVVQKTEEEKPSQGDQNAEQKPDSDFANQSNGNKTPNNIQGNQTTNNKQMQNYSMSGNYNTSLTSNMQMAQGTTTETAVYNGSANNYLSNLEIEGATLSTTFNKENRTYFVNTENLTSINITATPEDEDAKVCITGEENLKSGENKILISVTAENGDVRYYRIFIENK